MHGADAWVKCRVRVCLRVCAGGGRSHSLRWVAGLPSLVLCGHAWHKGTDALAWAIAHPPLTVPLCTIKYWCKRVRFAKDWAFSCVSRTAT